MPSSGSVRIDQRPSAGSVAMVHRWFQRAPRNSAPNAISAAVAMTVSIFQLCVATASELPMTQVCYAIDRLVPKRARTPLGELPLLRELHVLPERRAQLLRDLGI